MTAETLAKSVSPTADADAMARLARGEISALGEIYDRHHLAVLRFVSRAGADDPEDLVHATFLAVPKLSARYDGRQSCRPWLFGIAARLVQRSRRTRSRFVRAMSFFGLAQRDDLPDPHRLLAARSELGTVERALAQLSEPKRIAIVMAEVEGLSCEEIAAALGIPIGTVWTRLHHARRELRELLAPSRGET